MNDANDSMSCEELKAGFEAISEDNDMGRMDLRSDPKVVNHLKGCPACEKWVTDFLKKFIE